MQAEIEKPHRTALSAWNELVRGGGLEPEGRDAELMDQVRGALNCEADSLEEALRSTSMKAFVETLFRAIEPFPMMFADILRFFRSAGAREGERQWRLVIGDEVLDLKHFEQFERAWRSIECEFDVPAVSGLDAFLPNTIRNEFEESEHLLDSQTQLTRQFTGIRDVDAWLDAYDADEYAPFPRSLLPEVFPDGLDDAARIVVAALHVVRSYGHDRPSSLAEYRARRGSAGNADWGDALNIGMIAQNETDYWLRTTVLILGTLVAGTESARAWFGTELRERFARLPRRRLNARIDVEDLMRLLSLPTWRKRHELFAVWVATEIIAAAEGHEVRVNHEDGELRFAFREARIADIVSARPVLSLFSERRTPLDSPIGKGRKRNVQPDYGLWREGWAAEECMLVVEVKHYKRSDGRSFRDALMDYARAHPLAVVMLVNYGPAGMRGELPYDLARRCQTIGDLNPRNRDARDRFREAVRERVGEPARTVGRLVARNGLLGSVVIDTSGSMARVLQSRWFVTFAGDLSRGGTETAILVDDGLRAMVPMGSLLEWIRENELDRGTRLARAVEELIRAEGSTLVVTDGDGMRELQSLHAETELLDEGGDVGAKVVELRSRRDSRLSDLGAFERRKR